MIIRKTWKVGIGGAIMFVAVSGVLGVPQEDSITAFLLNSSRYTKKFRPVLDHTDTIEVKHTLLVKQLVKMDEKSQMMVTDVRVNMQWTDQFLKWDPGQYGGIKQVNINSGYIWTPQVIVYNSANDDHSQDWSQYRAIVTSEGNVTWLVPMVIHSSCTINVKYFPMDEQRCHLKFGSWNFDVTKIDLRLANDHALTGDYVPNGEWKLLSALAERSLVSHMCCNSMVSEITYFFHLRRRMLFYVINFIMPCALIAVLTMLLFLMPEDTGERMAVGITILLSLAVFFLMVEEKLPISENLPLIGKYYCCTIIEVSLSLVAMCCVLVIVHRQPTQLPDWIEKYVLGYMARIVFYDTGLAKGTNTQGVERPTDDQPTVITGKMTKKGQDKKAAQPTAESKAIKIMAENIKEQEEENQLREKWIITANVFNRFFLVLFTFSVVITLLAMFSMDPPIPTF